MISTLPAYCVLREVTDMLELQVFHQGCVQNMLTLMDYDFISKDVVTVKQKFCFLSREYVLSPMKSFSILNTSAELFLPRVLS